MPRRFPLFLGLVSVLVGLVWVAPTTATAQSTIVAVADGKIKRPEIVLPNGTHKLVPAMSGGTISAATPIVSGLDDPNVRADNTADPGAAKAGVTIQSAGCSTRNPGQDVRVNQDCTFRRQAEELIKANPIDSRNLVA